MTKLLAVLTAIFVVYALYEVFATVSQLGDGFKRAVQKKPSTPPPELVKQPTVVSATATPPVTASVASPTKPAVPAVEPDKHINLRDPKTGEVSPVPGNYRFAKKWIKEAMVAEGLLPKVYKNSELTETLNAKAKSAIEQFKHLEKYHA